MNIAMHRLPAVLARSGLSRSTFYEYVSRGLWTKPVKLGPRAVGVPAHECDALNAARVAGMGEKEIRVLVDRLHDARKATIDGLLNPA